MSEKFDSAKAAGLAELAKLQKRYETITTALPHTYNSEKVAELRREKSDVSLQMNEIKRKHDVQPGDLDKLAAKPAGAAVDADADDTDPVESMSATDAVDAIGRMRSKEKLQQVIDNDTRASVKDAAKARLAAL